MILNEFLADSKWKRIIDQSIELKDKSHDLLKLNFFNLTSDVYYRENYHSHILKAFLEHPDFLKLFLLSLENSAKKLSIDLSHYQDAEVLREAGRIDIWIRDIKSRKCIIIENKINNAQDMERQIPRYMDFATGSDYEIDAIIYLSLDGHKVPYKGDWTEGEVETISEKLVHQAAYNGSDKDLFSVFKQFESSISDIDYLVLSRQYRNLINSLSIAIMNKPTHDALYDLCLNKENFNKLREASNLFSRLGAIRARRLQEQFNSHCKPFERVSIWKDEIAYFDTFITEDKKSNFAIDIHCQTDKYIVQFFDRNALEKDPETALNYLNSKGVEGFKTLEGNRRVEIQFDFPAQQKELEDFLEDMLQKLKKG